MEGRALKILAVLLVGALALFWMVRPPKTKLAVVESGILPAGADARVEGVTVFQASAKGELTLTANSAQWSREKEKLDLDGVDIRFEVVDTSGQQNRAGHITSERGEARTDGKQFSLEGRVVAEAFEGYRLETSDVSYDHETRKLNTNAFVHLNGPGVNLTGKGATVDYERQRIEVRGRVKANLQPAVLNERAKQLENTPK